jgi:hypothetical protein
MGFPVICQFYHAMLCSFNKYLLVDINSKKITMNIRNNGHLDEISEANSRSRISRLNLSNYKEERPRYEMEEG